jgi:hypothetical protein
MIIPRLLPTLLAGLWWMTSVHAQSNSDAFVGEYELSPAVTVEITKEGGRLYIESPLFAKSELRLVNGNHYVYGVNSRVIFVEDASRGRSILTFINGKTASAPKRERSSTVEAPRVPHTSGEGGYPDLVGVYVNNESWWIEFFEQDGELVVKTLDDEIYALTRVADREFEQEDGTLRFRFVADEAGKAAGVGIRSPVGREVVVRSLEGYRRYLADNRDPVETTIDPAILDQYVGEYVSWQTSLRIDKEQGRLYATLRDDEKHAVFPRTPAIFFYKDFWGRVEFEKNTYGDVVALTRFTEAKTERLTRVGVEYNKNRKAVSISPALLERYTGQYTITPDTALVFKVADGQLLATVVGGPADGQVLPLFAESESGFFFKAIDARLRFVPGADGKEIDRISYDFLGDETRTGFLVGSPLMQFWDAVKSHNRERVRTLVAAGVDPDEIDVRNMGALNHAAWSDDLAMAKLLLDLGADVNNHNAYGISPLHTAALRGALECAQLFVEHGASLTTRNVTGRTPLQIAEYRNRPAVVSFLQKAAERSE